jgi:hypothetical protein
MATMSDNIIAICLYIGIMAMAGTVLVLTIVYFVKPNPAKKAQSSAPADYKPVIDDTKPARKKLRFNFPAIKAKSQKNEKKQTAAADIKPITGNSEPVRKKIRLKFPGIKMKSKKTDSVVVSKKRPKMKLKDVVVHDTEVNKYENKVNESATVMSPGKSENEEKHVAAILEPTKLVTPVLETNKAEIKETTAVKSSVEASQENKDVKLEIKAVEKPEINPGPAAAVQPVHLKSEKPELSVPKETLKPMVTESVTILPPPAGEAGKPKPDTADLSVIEKEKPASIEAVKKESEPKMDNKNVKTGTTAAAENPQTPPVTVKTTTTTTTTTANSAAPKKAPEQKTSLDDFSQMFAKEVVDDSEATKLAKDMKEVEIDSLVKDGQDLVALLKRGRS